MNKVIIRSLQPRLITNKTHGFQFKIHADGMSMMNYVEALQAGKRVGHLDFSVIGKWMLARYGCFATSREDSLAEWSNSTMKDIAIEVENEIRGKFRGVGSTMVSVALIYARKKGLEGMRIVNSNPKTRPFWEKLGFIHQGDDMLLSFKTQNIPAIDIRRKDQT